MRFRKMEEKHPLILNYFSGIYGMQDRSRPFFFYILIYVLFDYVQNFGFFSPISSANRSFKYLCEYFRKRKKRESNELSN